MQWLSVGFWTLTIASDLIYFFLNRGADTKFELGVCHIILASINFLIPMLFQVSEAWTNAVFLRLFDLLQISDYNKQFNSQINKSLTDKYNPRSASKRSEDSMPRNSKAGNAQATENANCICCRPKPKQTLPGWSSPPRKQERSNEGIQSKKEKKLHKLNKKNQLKPDSFYQETDFKNRKVFDIENLTKFWELYRRGIDPVNNLCAQMASVSIFAFIDKEGICTETQRYIDEVIVINKQREKQVLQLHHDPLIKKEDKIYTFNHKFKQNENQDALKALGLAFMLTPNPRTKDTCKRLQEMFLLDQIKVEKPEKT